jgi:hypothetical protein
MVMAVFVFVSLAKITQREKWRGGIQIRVRVLCDWVQKQIRTVAILVLAVETAVSKRYTAWCAEEVV